MKSLDISGFFVKCTILIVVFEISVVCTFAQKTDFGGGFTFGNTISAMSAENIPGFWKTGLTTGLFGHVKVVDKYKVRMLLQMDMNFTMKGTRTKPNFGAEGHYRRDKYSLNIHCLLVTLNSLFWYDCVLTAPKPAMMDCGLI